MLSCKRDFGGFRLAIQVGKSSPSASSSALLIRVARLWRQALLHQLQDTLGQQRQGKQRPCATGQTSGKYLQLRHGAHVGLNRVASLDSKGAW